MAGCGSSTAAPAPTKAAYIAEVNALCKKSYADPRFESDSQAMNRIYADQRLSFAEAAAKLAPLWEKEVSVYRFWTARADALRRPRGDVESPAFQAAENAIATTEERIVSMLRAHPSMRAYLALGREIAVQERRLQVLAANYGFRACAEESAQNSLKGES
jgi:hypothetical protein